MTANLNAIYLTSLSGGEADVVVLVLVAVAEVAVMAVMVVEVAVAMPVVSWRWWLQGTLRAYCTFSSSCSVVNAWWCG